MQISWKELIKTCTAIWPGRKKREETNKSTQARGKNTLDDIFGKWNVGNDRK